MSPLLVFDKKKRKKRPILIELFYLYDGQPSTNIPKEASTLN